MVAFLVSVAITGIMVGGILFEAKRRPPGTPLTWGEAFVAAVYVFALLTLAYGIVPNQWLLWADNEMGWRKDRLGIPFFGKELLAEGISFGGRGRILISAEVIRDLIAVGIYSVAGVVTVGLWLWWQKRGTKTADETQTIGTSAFGRPLVKGS